MTKMSGEISKEEGEVQEKKATEEDEGPRVEEVTNPYNQIYDQEFAEAKLLREEEIPEIKFFTKKFYRRLVLDTLRAFENLKEEEAYD